MNNRDLVVRIIRPAEQPKPVPKEVMPPPREKNLPHFIANVLGLAGIGILAVFIAVNFFNLGFNLKDILVLFGLPLAVGIVTTYAIF